MRKIIIWMTIIFVLYMIPLQFIEGKESVWNYITGALQGLLGFTGAVIGVNASKKVSGKLKASVLLSSFALFSYGISLNIWSYYNIILGISAPYPSISDVFFAIARILLLLSLVVLVLIYRLNISKTRVIFAIILGFISGYSVYLFTGNPLITDVSFGEWTSATYFDVFWPIADVITAAFGVIVLNIAGGRIYKGLRVLILGLIISAIADVWFVLRLNDEVYWNGEPSDILLTISIGVIAYGILSLSERNSVKKIT